MAEIRIRRGTKAQLDTVMGGGTPLLSGEMGFTTDTKEVFISDGAAAHKVGRVLVGLLINRPTAGESGRMYYATDDNSTWVDDGSTWRDVSGGIANLDDVSDGTTYGRVLNTYLDTNRPDGLWDGSSKLDGSTLRTHLNTVAQHRTIDDGGSSNIDLWSAEKISLSIDQAVAGMDFQPDVLDIQTDATLDPGTPSTGDRYIITVAGALHTNFGTITGLENNDIVEYNGSAFEVAYDVSDKGEGTLVWDQDSNTFQKWDGTTWSEFGGLAGVIAGAGLTKSGNTINIGQGNGITVNTDTITINPDVSTGASVAPVSVTTSGVGVIVDNDSIGHTGGSIEVRKVDGGTFV